MKLFGNSRGTRHLSSEKAAAVKRQSRDNNDARHVSGGKGGARRKKKNTKRTVIIIVAVILFLAVAAVAFYNIFVKPPETKQTKKVETTAAADAAEEDGEAPASGRNEGIFTFIVLGCDDGNGNTDTIMVATFDTNEHKLNIVSIPRDTLVNVEWSVKKANTLWSYDGVDGMLAGISDILGYELDFYAIVNLDAFVKLIDEIGGVYYDVPCDMYYEDGVFSVALDQGYQYLTGDQAIGVVRFRSGYDNADIGRIETQQDFLKSVAQQLMENKNKLSISTLANVFLNDVDTDLTYGNIIWLAKEFFKLDMSDISFHTLPGNYGDTVYQGGQYVSYVTIYIDDWLKMINQYLNPFDKDIVESDLNILTRNLSTDQIYSTSGEYAGDSSWGNSGGSSSDSSYSDTSTTDSSSGDSSDWVPDTTPEPTAEPEPEPTVEPTPEPEVTPAPESVE